MFIRKAKYPVKPQLTKIVDHEQLPTGAIELARLKDDLNYGALLVLVRNNDNLSILKTKTRFMRDGSESYVCHQKDFPLGFLTWFPKALREFQNPPAQGGLHAGGMTSADQDVEGEMLCIQRAMDAGNHQQGYVAMNRSRCRRGVTLEGHFDAQEITFPENLLYEGGLLQLIEDLGAQYEKGLI